MGKKMHPGSGAVIGAQLVILLILTASLCVQSRKAAAENTYAVMEKSGEGSRAGEPEKAGEAGDSQKKKYIHWVEFNVPADVMENLSFGLSVDHVLAVTVSGLLGAVWKFVGPEWVFVLGAAVCLVHFGVAVWLGKRA